MEQSQPSFHAAIITPGEVFIALGEKLRINAPYKLFHIVIKNSENDEIVSEKEVAISFEAAGFAHTLLQREGFNELGLFFCAARLVWLKKGENTSEARISIEKKDDFYPLFDWSESDEDVDDVLAKLLLAFFKKQPDALLRFEDLYLSTGYPWVQIDRRIAMLNVKGWIDSNFYNKNRLIKLSKKGFEEIGKKAFKSGPNQYFHFVDLTFDKTFVFGILPFKDELHFNQTFWKDGYKKFIPELTNLPCYRSDEDTGPPHIDDKIWTMMNQAEFIVADISSLNSNVLIELGMALALNKKVYVFTYLPENRKLEEILPFDVKILPVYSYRNLEGLKEQLKFILSKN